MIEYVGEVAWAAILGVDGLLAFLISITLGMERNTTCFSVRLSS